MEVFLIALVFLFLLGSLQWAMPSRRERKVAKLRQVALVEGLHIRVGKPDDPAPVCYYLAGSFTSFALRRQQEATSSPQAIPGWLYEHNSEVGLSMSQQAALGRCTEKLPENVLYIRSSRGALELWWDEQAELETIYTLAVVFREMAEQLELKTER